MTALYILICPLLFRPVPLSMFPFSIIWVTTVSLALQEVGVSSLWTETSSQQTLLALP